MRRILLAKSIKIDVDEAVTLLQDAFNVICSVHGFVITKDEKGLLITWDECKDYAALDMLQERCIGFLYGYQYAKGLINVH